MTLRTDQLDAEIAFIAGEPRLVVHSPDSRALEPFEGTPVEIAGHAGLEGPLSPANASALRTAFPNLRPRPLGTAVSAGTGDRLGLATPGHARAFAHYAKNVTPVFAQQSFREMDRLHRTPQEVLDAATFGCVAAGWSLPVGSDADHIHAVDRIDEAAAAGFTTFTLDPGDAVQPVRGTVTADAVAAVDWAGLDDDAEAMVRRYLDKPIDLGDRVLRLSRDELMTAAVKYGSAIALTARMYQRVTDTATGDWEVEVAIDETALPTSFVEHHYFVSELERLGVHWVSFAPRYVDGFQKGIEFIGDVDALARNFAGHRAIARQHGDYKISVHSGSDKFSIYEAVIAAVDGRIHLKTSGTSWLCALDVIALRQPELLREIYRLSRDAYAAASQSYQVSATLDKVPDPDALADVDMAELVQAPSTRQILHVGYGASLTAKARAGGPIDAAVRAVLIENRDEYWQRLDRHLGRHLAPFSAGGAR